MNPLSTRPNRWHPITVFNLLVGLLFSLSALAQPAFLKEGLIAYYPFNGNANDESGNKYTGTETGLTYTADRFSKNGSSPLFNGVSSVVHLPINNWAAPDYSINCWVKGLYSENSEDLKGLVYSRPEGTDNINGLCFSPTGPWGPGFRADASSLEAWNLDRSTARNGNWWWAQIGNQPTLLDNNWRMITAVYKFNTKSPTIEIYHNGILIETSPAPKIPSGQITLSSLRIGADHISRRTFKGNIDDVRLYARALDASQVKDLYDYESTPPDNSFITNGLVAYYPFNGNANDESGSGNNGAVQGATLTADRNSSPNKAYRFDGSTKIDVGNPPTDEFDLIGDSTLSLWVSADKLQYQFPNCFIGKDVGPGTQPKWVFGLAADPNRADVKLYFDATTPGYERELHMTDFIAFPSKKYAHLVVVKIGKNLFIFKDGMKVYSGLMKRDFVKVPANLTIGYAEAPTPFVGSVDDVRIYNRALSDGEVKALYDYESTSPIQSPVFVSQPVSKTANPGENVVLSVGLQTAGTYNYQWQLNEQNIAGATASSLSVNTAVAGVYRYRVIVSNSAGTVISDTATLTVSTPPAPSIVTQPAPKTVQEGANVSFNVVAAGQGAIVYQWQFNEQNLPGATSATLNLNGVKLNTAGRYRVLVSSQYGVTISDTVTLTVNANPPPTIVTQPLSRTPAEGTQVSLTVTASGLGSLTYQWQINNQNIPGATSSTLVLSAVRPSGNGKYRVIVGNPYGTTISTEASITVVVTDSDSDGLSDYEELLLGTNANKADSDGDGLSDFAEVRTHGSNPLTTDTDADGYSDGIEVARDGNPNNRSVTPTGALAVFPAVDVEFYTLNGVKYQLEVSTDMAVWTAQGGVVVGNGGSQNHLVRASKATQFWRLKVVQ